MATPRLCAFCDGNITGGSRTWGYHHPSYGSLADSSQSYCLFCSLIYQDIQEAMPCLIERQTSDKSLQGWFDPSMDAYESTDGVALYRWSIRSLGKSREVSDVVVITFRVIPRSGEMNEMETFGLPERAFYCFAGDGLGLLLNKDSLGPTTNPLEGGAAQAIKWVHECDERHARCPAGIRKTMSTAGRVKDLFVPTRLVDVGAKQNMNIRIVNTEDNNIRAPYATLSHCWGKPDPENPRKDLLTRETMHDFTTVGIPWSWLCCNFQQAIEMTRLIGLRYIWIDSLCICQGVGGDFAVQGKMMHKVYRYSYINIAAADSATPSGGLWRYREANHVLPVKKEGLGGRDGIWSIVRGDIWEGQLLSGPLFGRGWVFQERMLAPRAMHFSKHQIFWDCVELSACETLPNGLPYAMDRIASYDRSWRARMAELAVTKWVAVSGKNDQSIESFWKAAVKAYTSCGLTNQSDKRVAIWSLAKILRDMLGEEYAVGLWEGFLAEQLAWRLSDYENVDRAEALTENPSWSWTSITGTIILNDRHPSNRVYVVTNHKGLPLNFRFRPGERIRPTTQRETSDNLKEDIALMQKTLENVEERRKGLGAGHMHVRHDEPVHHLNRDLEPNLGSNALEIEAYINTGRLEWTEQAAKWTLVIPGGPHFGSQEAVINAFPDMKPSIIRNHEIQFMVLSLSRSEDLDRDQQQVLGGTDNDFWLNGVGIMVLATKDEPKTYVRTGALQIRLLSSRMWRYLQNAGSVTSVENEGIDNKAGCKLFLW